ncbi:MAG: hypothetical protein AB7L09_02085 [Nitrospira sp.]
MRRFEVSIPLQLSRRGLLRIDEVTIRPTEDDVEDLSSLRAAQPCSRVSGPVFGTSICHGNLVIPSILPFPTGKLSYPSG